MKKIVELIGDIAYYISVVLLSFAIITLRTANKFYTIKKKILDNQ